MRVLHLSTTDTRGGAARGAYYQHRALLEQGVDSQMLVAAKYSNDPTVLGPTASMKRTFVQALRAKIDDLPLVIYRRPKVHALYSCSWLPSWVGSVVEKVQPDIVNLHWINDGFLRPETLRLFNRPIVWTLRDMWSFTGGCHNTFGCDRFESKCGACPSLSSTAANDYSRLLWHRKKRAWSDVNLTVVGLSSWVADNAARSSLFRHRHIEVIGNTIDFNAYKPIEQRVARHILNIDPDATVITFGAMNALSDSVKGFDYLSDATRQLRHELGERKLQLLLFGASEPETPPDIGIPVKYLGVLHDDSAIALAYAAGDLTVVPSRQETFPKTALESMGCARAVVAFDNSGVRDVIVHKECGYLAAAFDPNDFAAGMHWLLEDKIRLAQQSCNARQIAVSNYTPDKIAQKYVKLYESLL